MFFKLWRYLAAGLRVVSASAAESKTHMAEVDSVFHGRPYPGKSRLRIFETCITMCGILPRKSNGRLSGYLSLIDPSPAEISYILGPDWQSQIITMLSESPDKEERKVIPVPDDLRDEANHCLLMRRCGAMREGLPHGDYLTSPDPLDSGMGQQIMGWPSYGGVCVLPRSKISEYRLTLKELESIGAEDCGPPRAEDDPYVKKVMFGIKLQKQDDMDGFCKVLLEAGGTYYENIEDCLEVLRLGLATTDWMMGVLGSEFPESG